MFKQGLNHIRVGYRAMQVASLAALTVASEAAFAQTIIVRPLDPPPVPEIDALAGASALALLVGAIALIRERRKRGRDKPSD